MVKQESFHGHEHDNKRLSVVSVKGRGLLVSLIVYNAVITVVLGEAPSVHDTPGGFLLNADVPREEFAAPSDQRQYTGFDDQQHTRPGVAGWLLPSCDSLPWRCLLQYPSPLPGPAS